MKNWIDFSINKPNEGFEVLAYSSEWVDEDFNPTGIRVGFLNGDRTFISARWRDYQDTYMNGEELPEKWVPLTIGDLKSWLDELFLECEHGDQNHRNWLRDKFNQFYDKKVGNDSTQLSLL